MQLDLSFQDITQAEIPQILTVTALTHFIRKTLEDRINEVWVEGEISNLRKQTSGHCYFTLKDASAQVACVLFAQQARYCREVELKDGLEVRLLGQLTVYETRGQYQLVSRLIQPKGLGVLQAQFEAIKRKLTAEGLFDAERKRPLPRFPRRIGVVTSPTGAAIRDFLHVLARRHPAVEIILYPVRVQGKGAAQEIASAIRKFAQPRTNGIGEVDVIVATRGGGSIEDLWAFNEEEVARAIFESPTPIVSAVGHEIDFTIADFVADVRAPTPSAAAEILVADQEELRALLRHQTNRLLRVTHGALQLSREKLTFFRRSSLMKEPLRIVLEKRQTLDRWELTMISSLQSRMKNLRTRTTHTLAILQSRNPILVLNQARRSLDWYSSRLMGIASLVLEQRRHRLRALNTLLEALSPQATLLRGFTMTKKTDGSLLHSAGEAAKCQALIIQFADGELPVSPLTSSVSFESDKCK